MIFRHIPKIKVHVYGQISRRKYKFPAFVGKIMHAHTVCTRPFLILLKGPGYEAKTIHVWTVKHGSVVQRNHAWYTEWQLR